MGNKYKSLSVDEDVEKLKSSNIADQIVTLCRCFKKQFDSSSRNYT